MGEETQPNTGNLGITYPGTQPLSVKKGKATYPLASTRSNAIDLRAAYAMTKVVSLANTYKAYGKLQDPMEAIIAANTLERFGIKLTPTPLTTTFSANE